MPSPNPIQPTSPAAQNAANPDSDLARFGLRKVLGTFRGWILRKAVTYSTMASAATTAWLAGKFSMVESAAARAGVDHDTLVDLHAQTGELSGILGALVATVILGAVEAVLSRIAAKVAEEPVIPKAPPV